HDWASENEGSPDEPAEQDELSADSSEDESPAWGSTTTTAEPAEATAVEDEQASEPEEAEESEEPEPVDVEPAADATGVEIDETPMQVELSHEHAAGDLHIPDGYAVLEGAAEGGRRAVGVVVSRFNGSITTQLLDGALEELSAAGVRQDAITIMVVPGAFALPLAATALAKTRRFACVV